MEDDFPTICVNPSAVRLSSPVAITIKDEPVSEPDSPTSSCPASPLPKIRTATSTTQIQNHDLDDMDTTDVIVSITNL